MVLRIIEKPKLPFIILVGAPNFFVVSVDLKRRPMGIYDRVHTNSDATQEDSKRKAIKIKRRPIDFGRKIILDFMD